MEPTNPEIEAAIREDPNDTNAYLVYMDWLQKQGHPRGELIALQHALAEARKIPDGDLEPGEHTRRILELRKQELSLLKEFKAEFVGEQGADTVLRWHMGFIRGAATRGRDDVNDAGGIQLAALLEHPSTRFLQALSVSGWALDGVADLRPSIALCTGAPDTLRRLTLGRTSIWEREVDIGDISELLNSRPRLRELHVDADYTIETPGPLSFPDLERLTLFLDGEHRHWEKIPEGAFPALRRLALIFSPAISTVMGTSTFLPRFGAQLTHLSLLRTMETDLECVHLAGNESLGGLQLLDLSWGDMTDVGAEHLVEKGSQLPREITLRVEGNFLTEPGVVKLEEHFQSVVVGHQQPRPERPHRVY